MEIRQLEYFRKIAQTGSINEAARQLNMSQPPLSYQLKLLEQELDVVLFERSRQGVTMTEAGKTADFVRQYTLASGGPYCDCGYRKKTS